MTDPIDPIRRAVSGRYSIEREIGQGAFATVYLARDLRHDRDVAFKVLNADPNSETGELRFLREIRLLASLQHPNILPLIDSGHADAMLYYVMPYVAGESLRMRISRERQLGLEAAVAIARDVSGGLTCAHEKGIVHRDIKPENILLSAGRPIIADFGIARAIDLGGVRQLTRTGMGSPGTPAYMSPEQLLADREVDRRTDIYSLGAVLYEMLTGKPPFVGKDGFVRRFTEPPPRPSTARLGLPKSLDSIVTKALAREPNDRYSTAGEFSRALEGVSLAHPRKPRSNARSTPVRGKDSSVHGVADARVAQSDAEEPRTRGAKGARPVERARQRAVDADHEGSHASTEVDWIHRHRPVGKPLRTAVLCLAGIGAVALGWSFTRGPDVRDSSPARRWDLVLPDSAPLAFVGSASLGIGRPSLAVAPNGSRLVYAGQSGTTTALYYHDLDKMGFTRLSGTEGAYYPFFSPDGRWVAFYAEGFLKKVSIPEGQLITLARVKDPMGGDWAADGRILVADDEGSKPAWVSEAGGSLERIPLPTLVERQWRYPRLLPGAKWVVHTDWDGALAISSVESGREYGVTARGITSRDSADVSSLLFGTNPVYVMSGHILFLTGSGGILMALPFDGDRRLVLGTATPVLKGVRQEAEGGGGQFAIAADGTLVYAPGVDAGMSQFVWLEPPAKLDTLPIPRAKYGSFDLSPNGKQLLVRVQSPSGRGELWLVDLSTHTQNRIATVGIPLYSPRWWPDGKRVVFAEFMRAGGLSAPVVRQTPESFSHRDTLVAAATEVVPSPDGKTLAVTGWRKQPGLWMIPVAEETGQPVRLFPGPVNFLSFSPNGKWIVYGVPDPPGIYASSTQTPDERFPISAGGGEEPRWSPRGDRIVYRDRQQWFAVDVATQNGFRASAPRILFSGPYLNVPGWSHAISADGRRQLLLVGPREESSDRLVAVTNWFSEVRRLAPSAK